MAPSLQPEHEKALALARAGEWLPAARLLANLTAAAADPWLGNDLAVCLHQAGQTGQAVKVLQDLARQTPVPALVRLNQMYLENALELLESFDPKWEHRDHDGAACPDSRPRVSVIVRTYQRPDLLQEALASLAGQTFTDFETIVVNDGGDPASEAAARASGLPRARYVLRPHEGRVHALNTGLEMAHGEFVTGLDDDDVVYPDHLERLVGYLTSADAAPVVYGDYRVARYAERGGRLVPVSSREVRLDDYRPGALFTTNPCTILLMARRSCYEEVGRFCSALELAEDWEMWLRLAARFPFHHLPAVTAEVRERPGTVNLTARRLREKYFWDNTVLFLHRGLVLLSAPETPELFVAYRKVLTKLDDLLEREPAAMNLLNLRGLWTMKKPYAWFADQGRWFLELGEREPARQCYRLAAALAPFEPKLWAGWARSFGRQAKESR